MSKKGQLEVEYRFLVQKSFLKELQETVTPTVIYQGYLKKGKEFHLRIRVEHPLNRPDKLKATLTTKTGKKPARMEYEAIVENDHGLILLEKASTALMKLRYKVEHKGLIWEIDYYPDKKYLVAEVELPSKDYPFEKPDWAGKEVTFSQKYSNMVIAKKKKYKL